MQKITPYLWFNMQAEEAMRLYTSIFDGQIISISRHPDAPPESPTSGMEGKVLHGVFELAGMSFMALDGGPMFNFTPAVSLFVDCPDEAAFDHLWSGLSEGGQTMMEPGEYPFSPKFGWLADRYGLSWQISVASKPLSITPSLLFTPPLAGRAEEAIRMYTALFPDSAIDHVTRYEAGEPGGAEGMVKLAKFHLAGQLFNVMDSDFAHGFSFTEATSLFVTCETQEEVDHLWNALSAVPESEACGWLKDKYGVSWQIIPNALMELMGDPDPEKAGRVMNAILQMKKIDVAGLERAYAG